jgi:hypothetical protein
MRRIIPAIAALDRLVSARGVLSPGASWTDTGHLILMQTRVIWRLHALNLACLTLRAIWRSHCACTGDR